ncbi:MAG: glycosyltransferase family 2 protein [Chloroflexi bacterium]|nr:glycosyltransferase family 2 protein [Chloroflexota bacterium]
MSAYPDVCIIVLNWNNAAATVSCLRSLQTITYPAYEVVLVDNGSTDDSVQVLSAAFPTVTLLQTGANLGYAGGNNAGIRYAVERGAQFILILNNDITVSPDFLEPLVEALKGQPDVGVVTPLVAEQGKEEGRVWALGSAIEATTARVSRRHAGDSLERWLHEAPFEVDIAAGAAMLVRAELFARTGLLDEDFFLYYEETDWSLRIRRAGYRILAVPASLVWHKVSATLGIDSPVIDYYMLRNHFRLINRHWSGPARLYLWIRLAVRHLLAVAAFTVDSHGGLRTANRNARLFAIRDAVLGRWGQMGPDVAIVCFSGR